MNSFVHEAHPARVVFGNGVRARLADEADRLGITRAFVVGSPRLVAEAVGRLGARVAGTQAGVVMHVPQERAPRRRAAARPAPLMPDGVVALGGGVGDRPGFKAIALGSGVHDPRRPDQLRRLGDDVYDLGVDRGRHEAHRSRRAGAPAHGPL